MRLCASLPTTVCLLARLPPAWRRPLQLLEQADDAHLAVGLRAILVAGGAGHQARIHLAGAVQENRRISGRAQGGTLKWDRTQQRPRIGAGNSCGSLQRRAALARARAQHMGICPARPCPLPTPQHASPTGHARGAGSRQQAPHPPTHLCCVGDALLQLVLKRLLRFWCVEGGVGWGGWQMTWRGTGLRAPAAASASIHAELGACESSMQHSRASPLHTTSAHN